MNNDTRVASYIVVVSDDLDQFIHEVQECVDDGWQPFGSLVVSHVAEKVFFYQVVIKTAKID